MTRSHRLCTASQSVTEYGVTTQGQTGSTGAREKQDRRDQSSDIREITEITGITEITSSWRIACERTGGSSGASCAVSVISTSMDAYFPNSMPELFCAPNSRSKAVLELAIVLSKSRPSL